MGIKYSNSSLNISRSDFENGYALFLFDLDGDPSGTKKPAKTGSVKLELKFAQATNATLNLVLLGQFDSFIEIDKQRNVITPF